MCNQGSTLQIAISSNIIQICGSDGKYSLLASLKFFIESNNQTAATHQLTEKIAILQEKGHIQKVEIDRQKLIINGLQRNLEHMTTSTKKDKQTIEQLNSKIYQLKKLTNNRN